MQARLSNWSGVDVAAVSTASARSPTLSQESKRELVLRIWLSFLRCVLKLSSLESRAPDVREERLPLALDSRRGLTLTTGKHQLAKEG